MSEPLKKCEMIFQVLKMYEFRMELKIVSLMDQQFETRFTHSEKCLKNPEKLVKNPERI